MPNTEQGDEQGEGEHERQLDAIIAEYYRLSDAGGFADQNEFIRRNPDFASELKDFFSDARLLHSQDHSDPTGNLLGPTIALGTSRPAKPAAGSVVRYFGEYEILKELGSGGMGVVYKARQVKLKRIVALKMIRSGELANSTDLQRFEAEAKAAAKLSHPGIVSVHEVGIHNGQNFYTMDYVEGGNLSQLHREEPVPAKHAVKLVHQLSESMHYAHLKGIVHRDLKPANILLTADGEPRITDFGLAKRVRDDDESHSPTMTESGQILGTAGYMSPEQASGKSRLVGPSSDVYSLGAVLYALLTSRALFVGETPSHTIMQVLQNEPISPRRLNPSVPRDLETICLKCLEKDAYTRYGSAQLLADDLGLFQEGKPVKARPVHTFERGWRWYRRNSLMASLTATLFVSLLIGTGVSWYFKCQSDNRADANFKLAEEEAKARRLAETKNRQIARRNYVLLLNQAPNLWGQARLDDLRDLLNEAELLNENEFAAAFWSERLKAASPQTSHAVPTWTQFAFSSDGQWAALVRTHTDDQNLLKGAYKRSVAELYRVIYTPYAFPLIRFEYQRELAIPTLGSYSQLAFVLSEKKLAVVIDKTKVKLIDLESDTLSSLFETKCTMYGVRHFSATGSHLLNYDGDEDRWELWSLHDRTPKFLPKLKEFSSQAARRALSDDGQLIASTTGLVIRVDGSEKIKQLDSTIGSEIKFSPDNRFLGSHRTTSRLSFLNLASGDEVFELPKVSSYTFSQSNRGICFVVSAGVLHRVDLDQRKSTQLDTIGPVKHLTLIPGDDSIVLGALPDRIAAWRTSHTSSTSTLRIGQIQALSANRRYAVTRGKDRGVVEVWDLFDKKRIAEIPEPGFLLPDQSTQAFGLATFAVSNEALVATHVFGQNQVILFDARQNNNRAEPWQPKFKTPPAAYKKVGITPDGKTILLAEAGFLHGTSYVQREDWTLEHRQRNTYAIEVSPDSKWFIAEGECWSLVDRTRVKRPSVNETPAFEFSGKWVTLNAESWLAGPIGKFFNPTTGKLPSFASMEQPFRGLAISPDGRILAVVSDSAPQVRVFIISEDEQDRRLWPVLELESTPGFHCVFMPDNRTGRSHCLSTTITRRLKMNRLQCHLWKSALAAIVLLHAHVATPLFAQEPTIGSQESFAGPSMQPAHVLSGHKYAVEAVAISPDMKTIASGGGMYKSPLTERSGVRQTYTVKEWQSMTQAQD